MNQEHAFLAAEKAARPSTPPRRRPAHDPRALFRRAAGLFVASPQLTTQALDVGALTAGRCGV